MTLRWQQTMPTSTLCLFGLGQRRLHDGLHVIPLAADNADVNAIPFGLGQRSLQDGLYEAALAADADVTATTFSLGQRRFRDAPLLTADDDDEGPPPPLASDSHSSRTASMKLHKQQTPISALP